MVGPHEALRIPPHGLRHRAIAEQREDPLGEPVDGPGADPANDTTARPAAM
jgi:hypothetical protein